MKQLSTAELNELAYRVGTAIKNKTTWNIFFMTAEEAEFFYEKLTNELYERAAKELKKTLKKSKKTVA